MNPPALFVSRIAPSLNLVGSCATGCCEAAECQEERYFFIILFGNFKIVSRSQYIDEQFCSIEAWESEQFCSTEAWESLSVSLNEIMGALQIIIKDTSEKPPSRFEASGLFNSFDSLEMCFLALWNKILERFK